MPISVWGGGPADPAPSVFSWWSYGRPSVMEPKGSQWSVVHLMVCSCEMGKWCVFEVRTLIPGRSRKLSDSFIWLAAMSTMFARVRLVPTFLTTDRHVVVLAATWFM